MQYTSIHNGQVSYQYVHKSLENEQTALVRFRQTCNFQCFLCYFFMNSGCMTFQLAFGFKTWTTKHTVLITYFMSYFHMIFQAFSVVKSCFTFMTLIFKNIRCMTFQLVFGLKTSGLSFPKSLLKADWTLIYI